MRAKILLLLGAVLVVLSAVALWLGGIPYSRETSSIDVGPIEASATTRKELDVPPWLAWVTLGGGVVVLVMGVKAWGRE